MAMIEMVVEGIGIDPQNNPLVLLRDEDRTTFVPIWIGPAEAVAIDMELNARTPQRPMTHDLIANMFRDLDIRLVQVTVNDFSEQVYYALLHLQLGRDDATREVDARPSDAIALALRARCPILVHDSVAQKTGIQVEEANELPEPSSPDSEEAQEEIDKFARLLEGVDLGDEDDKPKRRKEN